MRSSSKTVGLIGGLGPESTIDYYRRILTQWEREDPGSSPHIVIDSLDVQVGLRLVASDHVALAGYLDDSVQRLARAGVDFIALTANTGHIVFDEIAARSPVPMISIVECCADTARRLRLEKLLLLGTRFTMEATFYRDTFARFGIKVISPNAEERAFIHACYVGELLKGVFRDETREAITAIVARMIVDDNLQGVILGGTELPLLLEATSIAGIPLLDTTALHVSRIVESLAAANSLE